MAAVTGGSRFAFVASTAVLGLPMVLTGLASVITYGEQDSHHFGNDENLSIKQATEY